MKNKTLISILINFIQYNFSIYLIIRIRILNFHSLSFVFRIYVLQKISIAQKILTAVVSCHDHDITYWAVDIVELNYTQDIVRDTKKKSSSQHKIIRSHIYIFISQNGKGYHSAQYHAIHCNY